MDAHEQSFILREIDRWASDGTVTPDQANALRARYAAAALLEPAADASSTTSPARAKANASDWLQLVGGLLVGAGFVAFVLYLGLDERARAYVLAALGALAFGGGVLTTLRLPHKRGLSEAMLAAGLVAMGVAGPMASGTVDDRFPAIVASIAGIVAMWLRKGDSPIVVIGTVVFAIGTFVLTRAFNGGGAGENDVPLWWGLLLAFGAFALLWRAQAWANVALAVLVLPLVIAEYLTIDRLQVYDSLQHELYIGLQLLVLVGAGAYLGARGLVAGAAAGLTIDAVTFSFDVGGPLTALVLLLALGGLLVWQAEFVRGYFRKRSDEPL